MLCELDERPCHGFSAARISRAYVHFGAGSVRYDVCARAAADRADVDGDAGRDAVHALSGDDFVRQFENGVGARFGLDAGVRTLALHANDIVTGALAGADDVAVSASGLQHERHIGVFAYGRVEWPRTWRTDLLVAVEEEQQFAVIAEAGQLQRPRRV